MKPLPSFGDISVLISVWLFLSCSHVIKEKSCSRSCLGDKKMWFFSNKKKGWDLISLRRRHTKHWLKNRCNHEFIHTESKLILEVLVKTRIVPEPLFGCVCWTITEKKKKKRGKCAVIKCLLFSPPALCHLPFEEFVPLTPVQHRAATFCGFSTQNKRAIKSCSPVRGIRVGEGWKRGTNHCLKQNLAIVTVFSSL